MEEPLAAGLARPQLPDRPGRVLVVDDDPAVADVVRRYLVRDGHAVECVHDGYEALRRVAEAPPDLVVLDLTLPGMDGLEVCRRLRARGPIPVVMLTSRSDETDRLVEAFTREQLLTEVWGWTFGGTPTVTVHVRRLREKLEPDPTFPKRILTVWGVGYRYEPEV
jgi:DNA-binding response OmpR family regulator